MINLIEGIRRGFVFGNLQPGSLITNLLHVREVFFLFGFNVVLDQVLSGSKNDYLQWHRGKMNQSQKSYQFLNKNILNKQQRLYYKNYQNCKPLQKADVIPLQILFRQDPIFSYFLTTAFIPSCIFDSVLFWQLLAKRWRVWWNKDIPFLEKIKPIIWVTFNDYNNLIM